MSQCLTCGQDPCVEPPHPDADPMVEVPVADLRRIVYALDAAATESVDVLSSSQAAALGRCRMLVRELDRHPADCYPCKGTGRVVGFGAANGGPCPADPWSEG